jgi:hypothetical protein
LLPESHRRVKTIALGHPSTSTSTRERRQAMARLSQPVLLPVLGALVGPPFR